MEAADFDVTEARNQGASRRMLGARTGLQESDGHDRDKRFEEGVVLLGCMAHARRKFEAAFKVGNALVRQPLEWMNMLFAIEREAKEIGIRNGEANLLGHRCVKSCLS